MSKAGGSGWVYGLGFVWDVEIGLWVGGWVRHVATGASSSGGVHRQVASKSGCLQMPSLSKVEEIETDA